MFSQNERYTPLMVALYKGYYEISKLLLDYNADVNLITVSGHFPLLFCFSRLEEDKYKFENRALCMMMIELILSKGADLNIRVDNNSGYNILMKLVSVDFEEEEDIQSTLTLIEFLIERGANKKMVTLSGESLEDTIKSVKYRDKIIQVINKTKQIVFYSDQNNKKTSSLKMSEIYNKSKHGNPGKINQIMLDRESFSENCCLIF